MPTGLLGAYFPGEDPMAPVDLMPRGLLGPSVLGRMQAHSDAQRQRMAAGDYSPTPMNEESMWLVDDLAGGLLGSLPGGLMMLGTKGASKADDIARLLREGRAAEVTDEMLGALSPNEQAKLFELYESGATGMDLPMDEASRLARAARGGFNVDDTRYHGTKDSIAAFDPAKTVDGSVHLGSRPEQANMRTYGEGANLIPAYLREGKMRRSRDSDGYWKAKAKSARRAGTDTVEYLNRYEGIPRERFDSLRESGSLSRLDSLTDAQFRRAVPEAADSYLVMDPANIRSRHARFDPRLSKNADLLAGMAGLSGLGLLGAAQAYPYIEGVE